MIYPRTFLEIITPLSINLGAGLGFQKSPSDVAWNGAFIPGTVRAPKQAAEEDRIS